MNLTFTKNTNQIPFLVCDFKQMEDQENEPKRTLAGLR